MEKNSKGVKEFMSKAADNIMTAMMRIIGTIMLITVLVGCFMGLYFFILHVKGEINLWEHFREAFSILFSCQ